MRTSSEHQGSRRPSAAGSTPGRRRALLGAAAAALLAAAVTGCGTSGGTSSAAGTPTGAAPGTSAAAGGGAPTATGTDPAPSATSAAPSGASPSSGTSASASASAGTAGSTRCTVTDLKLRLGRGDPGAGQVYYPLTFTNVTGHACTLDGYPGVSLLRGDGSVIGKPADRAGGKAMSVRLNPGQSAEADLHTLNEGVRSGGCWRSPTLIKVYPPGSFDAMTLATASPDVCGDTFDVGPVH